MIIVHAGGRHWENRQRFLANIRYLFQWLVKQMNISRGVRREYVTFRSLMQERPKQASVGGAERKKYAKACQELSP